MARSSRTRYAVLGMLAGAPMTGYTLREEINRSIGHFWHESDGQLYPTLRELEGAGLIATTPDPRHGRGRAVHRILPAGLAELRAWLGSDPESSSSQRNELLLQVFFGRHAEPGVIAAQLDRHRARVAALLDGYRRLERSIASDPTPDAPFWSATLRHGVRMAEAQLAWIDETLATLDEGGQP